MTRSFFPAVLAAMTLSGCAVGPAYVSPQAAAEKAYPIGPIRDPGPAGPGEVQQRQTLAALRPDWWTLLGSPEIDHTVELALANNWTLETARANLARASEGVAVARGGLAPQIDATGGAGHKQYGAYFLGRQAEILPSFSAYSAGVGFAYDLDVFGGKMRGVDQAAAAQSVQKEALNAARLSVAGSTVSQALVIAASRAQIDLIDAQLASDRQTLDIVHAARGAGVVSDVDVTAAQSQLDEDTARRPLLRARLQSAEDTLPVLVGKAAAGWTAPAFDLARMDLPEDLPSSAPSDLVRNRPDIRAAEAQLRAANAAVGVATADLYPHVVLTADVAGEGLLDGGSGAAWSLLGGLTAPIFHGGALSAQRRAAADAYDAAFAQYQQTVLTAFVQVGGLLHALATDADAVRTEKQALASADAALRLARLGYGGGSATLVQVLDAQRQRALAESGLVEARTQRYLDTVRLFLAVGGGQSPDAPAL